MTNLVLMAAALLVLACAVPAPTSAALPPNVITAWFAELQHLVRTNGIQSQVSARLYGVLGLAQYNALRNSPVDWNHTNIAAVASHTVLTALFPWRSNANDVLIQRQLPTIPPLELLVAKRAAVPEALKVLEARINDGFADWTNFKPAPTNVTESIARYQFVPGQTYSLYPQLANTRPLVLSDRDVERYAAPYAPYNISSQEYAAEYEFVRTYGARVSPNRSEYDSGSPAFWADGANTSAIGGHWLNISWAVLPSNLTLLQIAKFHAEFGAAAFDANVACWKVKYRALHWRPITAIRQGDGIRAADPTWTPLQNTPSHPEYPSGHQCTTGAAAQVLVRALGTANATFSIGTEGAPSLGLRTYTDIWAAAREVGDSNAYGGVHFQKANLDGLVLGQQLADAVLSQLNRA